MIIAYLASTISLKAKGLKDKEEELPETNIDSTNWKIEVERVLPQLKVHIKPDAKVVSSFLALAILIDP